MKPIKIAAINSHLPCPNGCSLSVFYAASFDAKITTMELRESDKECQASAINATELETTPAHIFNANRAKFTKIEIIPSR